MARRRQELHSATRRSSTLTFNVVKNVVVIWRRHSTVRSTCTGRAGVSTTQHTAPHRTAPHGADREIYSQERKKLKARRGNDAPYSWNSTTPTPTSSRGGSSRGCRRVGRVGDDVRVGVVECELNTRSSIRLLLQTK